MSNSLIIPSCPEVLLQLDDIMKTDDPDIQVISNLVNADVGLYSTLLATVNSPMIGLSQTVESVPQAIVLLGQAKTFTLLRSAIMRNSLEELGRLDDFWSTATEVAHLCSILANRLTSINQEKAYSIGMLHDIGIPIMMSNHSSYKDFLKDAGHVSLRDLSAMEMEHYHIDHFTLGYRLAKEWKLPPIVSKTILLQPLFDKAFDKSIDVHENLLSYLAILILAKDISNEYQNFWRLTSADHFPEHIAPIIEFLEISAMEYLDLKDNLIEDIQDQDMQDQDLERV
jgi:HD-like signal output (HDOD) protein